tara:strand:- start:1128 stop:2204 length:1077 start_codon:yes stop_codon:yes gene_type:complete
MMDRRNILKSAVACPVALASGAVAGTPRLKYLQIGVGHAHATKIDTYHDSDDWEVVGIVEEDPELLARARSDPRWNQFPFLTLEEGLNLPGLSAVGIETEIRDLLRYAQLAVDAGYHVHLDKPAGASLEEYSKLLEQADQSGLVVQMGYMYRYNPAVQLLHRMIGEGWLGGIFETHAVMSKVIAPPSRQVIDEFSGGTMFELGCHIIDLTVGVLGPPNSVTAYPRRFVESEDDSLVDNMLAVLEYPGATATIRSTGLEVEGFSRRHFAVCGTEGTCQIQPLDRPEIRLSLSRDRQFEGEDRIFKKGVSVLPFDPPYRRYVGDAAALASVIRGGIENPFPPAYDLAVQKTVLQASGMEI